MMKAILATTLVSATALSSISSGVLGQSTNDDTLNNDSTNLTTLLSRQVVVSKLDNQPNPVPIHITAYDKVGCKGHSTNMKDNTLLGHSYDRPGMASVHIDRDLMSNEQLDFSWQMGKKKRGLKFRGVNVPGETDVDDDDDEINDDDGQPTAVEGRDTPTLTKRAPQKHCERQFATAPSQTAALASGCWDIPTHSADCWRLWMYPGSMAPTTH